MDTAALTSVVGDAVYPMTGVEMVCSAVRAMMTVSQDCSAWVREQRGSVRTSMSALTSDTLTMWHHTVATMPLVTIQWEDTNAFVSQVRR